MANLGYKNLLAEESSEEKHDIGVLFDVTHCGVLNLDKEPIMDTQSAGTLTSWIE